MISNRFSRDFGQDARYIVRVFEEDGRSEPGLDWEEHLVRTTPAGRKQLRLLVARERGRVKELVLEDVPTSGDATRVRRLLHLRREHATRLVDVIRALDSIPIAGDDSVRLDDDVLNALLHDPHAVEQIYRHDPVSFREAIQNDENARDLAALAHRRRQVERFRAMLADSDAFSAERSSPTEGRERVWQRFLEQNPWILGVSLSGLFLTSWSRDKLEQTVAGNLVGRSGKRVDALLQTAGQIRSMVFAEIKHDETPLLAPKPYRSECWPPSQEVTGGVTQIQQTVLIAQDFIKGSLPERDEEGNLTGEATHLLRPRSFLIVGNSARLRGEHGINPEKYRSFELYRRNLYEPEIVTFDELLARAEWHVSAAERDG